VTVALTAGLVMVLLLLTKTTLSNDSSSDSSAGHTTDGGNNSRGHDYSSGCVFLLKTMKRRVMKKCF
jgi:hypothetical protein